MGSPQGGESSFGLARTVLQRFGNVLRLNSIAGGEIGNGARKFQHPVIGACTEAELSNSGADKLLALVIQPRVLLHFLWSHIGIGLVTRVPVSPRLHGPGRFDPFPDIGRMLTCSPIGKLLVIDTRYFEVDIDSVQ